MTLPQLQNLNQQINNIINRGRIFTEVERTQRKEKYRVTTRNGIEINREYLGCEDDVTKTFEYVDLSSQNQSDLTVASNILGQMISVKTGINAVINFLHQNADNSDIKISIDDALSLTDKFIGPVPNDHPLSPKSDSIARFSSFDGLRQVRWDIEPRHARGIPHFNFEIINSDKKKLAWYMNQLSQELGFQVKNNYHLFVKE